VEIENEKRMNCEQCDFNLCEKCSVYIQETELVTLKGSLLWLKDGENEPRSYRINYLVFPQGIVGGSGESDVKGIHKNGFINILIKFNKQNLKITGSIREKEDDLFF